MTLRHTKVARNAKRGIKASMRSNVNVSANFKNGVSGDVDPLTVNVTINRSNLDNPGMDLGSILIATLAAVNLVDGSDTDRREAFLSGQG